jgi:hypothetical protein
MQLAPAAEGAAELRGVPELRWMTGGCADLLRFHTLRENPRQKPIISTADQPALLARFRTFA